MGWKTRWMARTLGASCLMLVMGSTCAHASLWRPLHVAVGYDASAQWSSYHTYSWGKVTMAVPAYEAPVKAAIQKELGARGWQWVPSGGSATVFILGNIQGQQQLDDLYQAYGKGWDPPWGLHGLGTGWAKDDYGELTHIAMSNPGNNLVVDMFDSNSHLLLVRGVAGDDLANTEKKNVKNLQKILHKMLHPLPKV